MTLDLPVLLGLGSVALVVGALPGVGGLLLALLLSVAVASALGVKAALPVVATAMIARRAARAWLAGPGTELRRLPGLLLAALPFLLLGAAVYRSVPEDALAATLGVVLLVALPLRRLLGGRSGTLRPALSVARRLLYRAGFVLAMILVPLLLAVWLAGEGRTGTDATAEFLRRAAQTVSFGVSTLLTFETALLGIALGICTLPGRRIGRRISKRTRLRAGSLALDVGLVIGALYFLTRGFSG